MSEYIKTTDKQFVRDDDTSERSMFLRELAEFDEPIPPPSECNRERQSVHFNDSDISAEDLEFLETVDLNDLDSLWDEDDVFGAELHRIAKECITNNWYRTDSGDGGWHYFSDEELAAINERTGNNFDYGYCFLDEAGGTEGLIRLVAGHANPKWMFWMEDCALKIDLA